MGLGRFLPTFAKDFLIGRALRIGRLLRRLGVKRPRRFGVTIDVQSPMITDQCVAALFWGTYEWGERKAIRRFLMPDTPIIEIGASIGFITNLAARYSSGQKQVALEANPNLIPLLQGNIDRNNNTAKVRVVQAAIDYSGQPEVSLDIGTGSNLSGALIDDPRASPSVVPVPATTLGRIARDNGIEKYVLISDIEGAEIGLLKEDAETMQACQQMIIELHPTTDDTGKRLGFQEVGERIAAAWGLTVQHRDGCIWVLQRKS